MDLINKITMTGKTLRFVNFLLDSGIFFMLLVLFILAFRSRIASENIKWISCTLYFLYYFLFEYFNGQTIGKMITKTKVVSFSKNNNLFIIRLFIRALMRFIPIDIISYLFTYRGLHDLISMTTVIKLNDRTSQK